MSELEIVDNTATTYEDRESVVDYDLPIDPTPRQNFSYKILNRLKSHEVMRQDAESSPFNCVCKIRIGYKNFSQSAHGTASLISPTIAITSAHNVYSFHKETGKLLQASQITFIPGGGYLDSKSSIVTNQQKVLFLGKWKDEVDKAVSKSPSGFEGPDRSYDYAVICLPNQIQIPNYFTPSSQLQDPITVAGLIKTSPSTYSFKRTETNQNDISISGGTLRHICDTTCGTSGAPIICKLDNNWKIIGIHSKPGGNDNLATYITNETVNKIGQMVERLS